MRLRSFAGTLSGEEMLISVSVILFLGKPFASLRTKVDWVFGAFALWVRVLRAKYRCGSHIVSRVKSSYRMSNVWRHIIKLWPFIEDGLL